jgi:hypothetical protein
MQSAREEEERSSAQRKVVTDMPTAGFLARSTEVRGRSFIRHRQIVQGSEQREVATYVLTGDMLLHGGGVRCLDSGKERNECERFNRQLEQPDCNSSILAASAVVLKGPPHCLWSVIGRLPSKLGWAPGKRSHRNVEQVAAWIGVNWCGGESDWVCVPVSTMDFEARRKRLASGTPASGGANQREAEAYVSSDSRILLCHLWLRLLLYWSTQSKISSWEHLRLHVQLYSR